MLKYNGKGFIRGVPARDLTDEEVRTYGREMLLKSGLYKAEGGLFVAGEDSGMELVIDIEHDKTRNHVAIDHEHEVKNDFNYDKEHEKAPLKRRGKGR